MFLSAKSGGAETFIFPAHSSDRVEFSAGIYEILGPKGYKIKISRGDLHSFCSYHEPVLDASQQARFTVFENTLTFKKKITSTHNVPEY